MKKIILPFNVLYFTFLMSSIIAIALICFNKFIYTDDMAFIMELGDNNVFNWAWDRYFNWDGRHLTPWGILQAFNIKYLHHTVILLMYFTAFCSAILLMVKMEFNKTMSKLKNITFYLLIVISFFFMFKAHITQTLFWAVGGFYSVMLLGITVWLYFFNKNLTTNKTLFYIYSFFIGASTQNITAPLLFIIIAHFIFNNKYNKKHLMLTFIAVLAGGLFITLAPGNANRAVINHESLSIIAVIKNFGITTFQFLLISKALLLLTPYISIYAHSNNFITKNTQSSHILVLFGAALASVAPFALVTGVAANRTAIYFQFFLAFALIHLWIKIFQYLKTKGITLRVIKQVNSAVLIVFLTAVPILNFINSFEIKEKNNKRIEIVKANRGNDLILEPIAPTIKTTNFLTFFNDISTDPDWWSNKAFAAYYNLKSVKISEEKNRQSQIKD